MYRALLILIIVLTSILLISGDWAHGLSQDQEQKVSCSKVRSLLRNSSEPTCDDESQKPEELTETNVTEPMEEQLEEVETENISFPTSIRVVGYDSKLNIYILITV